MSPEYPATHVIVRRLGSRIFKRILGRVFKLEVSNQFR